MQFTGTDKYTAKDLATIVSVAAGLERPLLIRGEPERGRHFLQGRCKSLSLEMFNWHVKSTSRPRTVSTFMTLFSVLTILGLAVAMLIIEHYIKLGPLGQAFEKSTKSIVLIDEIDKADVEFPNDLLHELGDELLIHGIR